jgi:hypothetical protein
LLQPSRSLHASGSSWEFAILIGPDKSSGVFVAGFCAEGFAGGLCTRTAEALVAPVTNSNASEAAGHTRLSQGAARFFGFSCGRMPVKENWFPLFGHISQ